MFNYISIIGCGLIGSSILRAINEKKISKEVRVFDKSKEVLSFIKQENLCQNIFNDINKCVENSDLIIISTPLSSYKEIILSIKNNLKKNVILTDTGSVKKEVNKIIKNLNLRDIIWISSHPIAGTEESGPKSGFSKLFENRWCIISTEEESKVDEIKKLKKFWELLGSKVKIMSIEEHDYILSLTSHLPHAIAYNLVKTAIGNDSKFRNDIIQYLNKKNIGTRLLFGGNLAKQPYFNNVNYRISGRLDNCDTIMNEVFWLGVQPNLSEEMKSFVVRELCAAIKTLA